VSGVPSVLVNASIDILRLSDDALYGERDGTTAVADRTVVASGVPVTLTAPNARKASGTLGGNRRLTGWRLFVSQPCDLQNDDIVRQGTNLYLVDDVVPWDGLGYSYLEVSLHTANGLAG
jgi:hypothetical protein